MLALIVVELPTEPRPPVDSEAGKARSEMTAMAIKAPSWARKMSAKMTSFHLCDGARVSLRHTVTRFLRSTPIDHGGYSRSSRVLCVYAHIE